MKKISQWASRHTGLSRLLIVAIKIILLVLAAWLGLQLSKAGVSIPVMIAVCSVTALLILAAIYPSGKKGNYAVRKTCDFLLSTASFLFFVTLVNREFFVKLSPAVQASLPATTVKEKKPTAAEILKSLEHRDKHSLTRKEKRILKQEFKVQLKRYVVAKVKGNKRDSGDALMIMLAILGAIGLMYILAALVCSLSCSGADAAAVILGVLGLAAILIGTIVVIRSIQKKPRRRDRWEPDEN